MADFADRGVGADGIEDRGHQVGAAFGGLFHGGAVKNVPVPFSVPAIIAAVRRDLDQSRATRGLAVATAGSVINGTRLTSLRAVMHAIQRYGRYA